jgi:hypothetical protein
MGLLSEIQADILDVSKDIAPVLLKLRLLAAKLKSAPLAEWVKFESEGYPPEVEIPDYRKLSVHYRASFRGPFNSGVNNAQIPPALIKKFAGDNWLDFPMRSSISELDDLLKENQADNEIQTTNASNLIMVLDGNIYPDYRCIDVKGILSRPQLAAIRNAVRTRVLEVTVQIENELPASAEIEITGGKRELSDDDSDKVSRIATKVVYGDNYEIKNSGHGAHIQIRVKKGDASQLREALQNGGLSPEDAIELADIVSSENPISDDEPLGQRAQQWLANNLKKQQTERGKSALPWPQL